MELAEIWTYPVKSCAGLSLARAQVDSRGIHRDRHWMLVDHAGRFVTQRQVPRMALIKPSLSAEALVLEAPGQPPLSISPDRAAAGTVMVQVWQDRCRAGPVDVEADRWLTDFLGVPVRLVFLPDDERRAVDPRYAQAGDEVGFADGFPFLLIGAASVGDLARRMDADLSMRRFRPNLVVGGAAPYAEDRWRRIRIGALEFRVAKPCSRCAITTVNPDTGTRDLDTLGALARYRRRDNKVYLGQNLVHDAAGELKVGDAVSVIE